MNRKTWVVVCLAVLLALGVALSAGAQGKKMDLGGQRLGIIFNATSLLGTMWPNPTMGCGRAGPEVLARRTSRRCAACWSSTTATPAPGLPPPLFGLSGAYEYHFVKGKVSPYTGVLAGIEINGVTGNPTTWGSSLVGILGVEVRVLDYLGLFAEYNLRLSISTIRLSTSGWPSATRPRSG